ncbi:hypothetical protein LCGC14_2343770, partial [marine sediment metagenome]
MYELKLLIPRIVQLQDQVAEVKIKIHDYVFDGFPTEIEKISEIPGVGITAGAAIIGFLGDVHRFVGNRASRKVTAFAGLAVMQYSSGQKERMGKISKAGPSLLRFHLGWSALQAVKTKGPLQDFFEGLVKRGVLK